MADTLSQMGQYANVSGSQRFYGQSRAAQELRGTSPMHAQASWDHGVVNVMNETVNSAAGTAATGAAGQAISSWFQGSGGSSGGTSGGSSGGSSSGGSSSGGGSDGTLWGARQQYADEFGF